MAFKRENRVADEVKRLTAEIIRTELDDPRVPVFTSITDVTVSSDFNYADLYVSVLAQAKDKQVEAVEALNSAKGFLRKELSQRLKLRVTPELRFHLDDSFDKGQRIDEILEQVKSERAENTEGEEVDLEDLD